MVSKCRPSLALTRRVALKATDLCLAVMDAHLRVARRTRLADLATLRLARTARLLSVDPAHLASTVPVPARLLVLSRVRFRRVVSPLTVNHRVAPPLPPSLCL